MPGNVGRAECDACSQVFVVARNLSQAKGASNDIPIIGRQMVEVDWMKGHSTFVRLLVRTLLTCQKNVQASSDPLDASVE